VYAVQGYTTGEFPPGVKSLKRTLAVFAGLVRGHAAAYHAIHRIQPTGRAGIALNYRSMIPARKWMPLDSFLAKQQAYLFNQAIPDALVSGVLRTPLGNVKIPEAQKTQDYFGLNYYSRELVALDLTRPGDLFTHRYYRKGAQLSTTGFIANEPEGMMEGLKWARRFGIPILITENGIEDSADAIRPTYLAEHIHQVWRAVNFNYPIKGYFHWSLTDNFEWERGWTQRFGLWELDEVTQTRRKRASADFYGEICRENGLTAEMVARYAPALFERMFPN
jgi:beta-glucosidase